MGQVTVTLNGRTYRLRCDDGEEERLLSVAGHVRGHVEKLTAEHGQIGDERLILMAAILITDELFELREQARVAPRAPTSPTELPRPPQPQQTGPDVRVAAPAAVVARPGVVMQPPSSVPPQRAMPPSLQAPIRSEAPPPPTTATALAPAPRLQPAVPPAQSSAPPSPGIPRPLEHLDATALMKGLEKKSGRP